MYFATCLVCRCVIRPRFRHRDIQVTERLHLVSARLSPDAAVQLTPEQTARFRALILPHLDGAYSLARFLARDPVAAEDIVQTAFLRALRGFPGFHGEAPKAWLFAILRNACFDWLMAHPACGPIADDASDHDADTPETAAERVEEARTVRSTIAALPEPFREAIVLRELEEMSYKEIALLTRVPIGTVMSRLARARGMLAKLLLPMRDAGGEAGR